MFFGYFLRLLLSLSNAHSMRVFNTFTRISSKSQIHVNFNLLYLIQTWFVKKFREIFARNQHDFYCIYLLGLLFFSSICYLALYPLYSLLSMMFDNSVVGVVFSLFWHFPPPRVHPRLQGFLFGFWALWLGQRLLGDAFASTFIFLCVGCLLLFAYLLLK